MRNREELTDSELIWLNKIVVKIDRVVADTELPVIEQLGLILQAQTMLNEFVTTLFVKGI